MSKNNPVRPIVRADLSFLIEILDETELFPSNMLESMISPFLDVPACTDYWLTYELAGKPVALLFCQQERMTVGTWNVLAVAVSPKHQSEGIGAKLMEEIESELRLCNQDTLIVETSGLPEYARSRRFYERIGYHKEAKIRDFYSKGEDKIVFWKTLRKL